MSQKSRFREPYDKQHGQWDQTVLKSEWHNFFPNLLITLKAIKFEKVSLRDIQNLRLLLTVSQKYSLLGRDNLK